MSRAEFGPVCLVDAGRYRAVNRNGVLVVERADSCGALREVEWESDEQRQAWELGLIAEVFDAD